jgi:LacI family transcriptional regulator
MARPPGSSGDAGGRVTLRTLARHLGLSVTTVSRALKNGPEVGRGTVERVAAAAKQMGYRPHLGGINLRTGRTHAVGIVLPLERPGAITNVVTALIEGASATLRAAAYRTTIVPVLPTDQPLDAIRALVEESAVDGLILTNTEPQDVRVKYLLQIGFPFVTFGRTELFSPHPWFDIDHQAVGAAAAALLFAAGHAAPVIVAPPAQLTYSRQFLQGWRAAHRDHGRALAEASIVFAEATPDSGRGIVPALLQARPDATAAFVTSEEAALGVIAGLAAAGRRPGRDVALVAYGGTRLHSFLNPPLSAFSYPHLRTGEHLARLLVRAIAGEDPAELHEEVQADFLDLGSQALTA